MKKICLTLFFSLILLTVKSQTVTYDNFKEIIPYLQSEDWKAAFKKSSILLKGAEKDTSDFKAIVCYINIFSAAGMVSKGEMTYKELEKNIAKFKGKKIVMSGHPVTKREGALRQISFDPAGKEAHVSATNAAGTSIFCFENFLFNEKLDLIEFPEKSIVRCGGILDKIEFNPNQSTIWILRLTVKDAFARRTDN